MTHLHDTLMIGIETLANNYNVCRATMLEMDIIVKETKNINRLVIAGEDVQVTIYKGTIFYYMTNREWTHCPKVEMTLEQLHEKMEFTHHRGGGRLC